MQCQMLLVLMLRSADPQVKQRLEADVKAAKQELELVKETIVQLSEEERVIREEERVYKDKLVCDNLKVSHTCDH